VFEILGGHVRDAEWRLGDWWTVSVLGLSRPYVRVAFGKQVEQSAPKLKFAAQKGCDVNFDSRIVFSLDEDPDDEVIKITVLDQRNLQAAVCGNPLIGTAEVRIVRHPAGALFQQTVELQRDDSPDDSPGWLRVQWRLVKRPFVRETLLDVGARPMHEICNAMVGLMKASDGLRRMLDSRPKQVALTTGKLFGGCKQEQNLLKRLERVQASFFGKADSCSEETDDEVLGRLAPLSRELLVLIADFAQPEKGEQLDTVALACEWMRNLFRGCIEDEQSVPAIVTSERLHRLFTSSHLDLACLEPLDASFGTIAEVLQWTPGVQPPPKSIVGIGAYARVIRARDKHTKQVCAVKQMMFGNPGEEAVTMRDCDVAERLCTIEHPCVVRLFSVHKPSETCAVLIMEYCSGGDLQNAIECYRRPGCYTVPPRAKKWLAQIFLGLEFLHLSIGMLIRDVKPQNVILTEGGKSAKLIDFGMSRLDRVSDGAFTFHPGMPPGSPSYVAPEIIQGAGYDYHADLYSLAVLAWVLYTGGLVTQPRAVPPCAQVDERRAWPYEAGGCKNRWSRRKEVDERRGAFEFRYLLNNWQMLKACIVDPRQNDARPLPSEEIKDFILRLTDRTEDYHKLGHEDVRNHPLLQDMALPPCGDTADNTAEAMQWMNSLGDD
jgi:hypothetical protein